MQNDLIVLSFSNEDGSEVLLDPNSLTNIAFTLMHVMQQLGPYAGVEIPENLIEVKIAAVRHGSIRIGFALLSNGLRWPSQQELTNLANLTTVFTGLTGVLAWTAISLGYASPTEPIHPDRAKEKQVAVENIGSRRAEDSIHSFIVSCRQAGAKQVTLIVPDAPACILHVDNGIAPEALGRGSGQIGEFFTGNGSGELTILDAPRPFVDVDGDTRFLARGHYVIQKRELNTDRPTSASVPVLVDWQSKRDIPGIASEPVSVTGNLENIKPGSLRATGNLSPEYRSVQGILTVFTRRVDE